MNPFRRRPQSEPLDAPGWVTMPTTEYHALNETLNGLVDRVDELEGIDLTRGAVIAQQVERIAERTDERERAIRWAVALEQENADLERANGQLRGRIDDLEHALAAAGASLPWPPLGTDDVEGVPA
jgi:hypothetical protein